MKIGFDFDGVISNLCEIKSRGAKKLFGVNIPEEIMHKHIVLRRGLLTDRQYDELQHFVYKTDFGWTMRPVIGLQPHMRKLQKEGYEIVVITSRDGKAVDIAREWLGRKGFDLPVVGIGRGDNKVSAARKHRLDVFVDDDLFMLEPLCGVVAHRLLFSWPYNAHIQESSYVKRVGTWAELYKEIALLGMWHVSGFPAGSQADADGPAYPLSSQLLQP
jgi:uncharacterized HAD superfamily protein